MIFSNYKPQSYAKMYRNFFVNRGFCRKLKMTESHFWTNVMLRQPHVQASRASPAQKSQDLRVVYSKKLFKGQFFCFLGNSFGWQIFELFAHETNLEKKRSVWPPSALLALARPCAPLRTAASGADCQSIQSSSKLAQSYVLEGASSSL